MWYLSSVGGLICLTFFALGLGREQKGMLPPCEYRNPLCLPFHFDSRVASFSEPLARHYFKQAVLGVMYLHERGVFHR